MDADYRTRTLAGTRVTLRRDLPDDWVDALWAELPEVGGKMFHRALPGGGHAVVKTYLRRAKHTLLRRLRKGRATREGEGFLAFRRSRLPTVRLLMSGERRRFGLHHWGVVVTRFEDAPTMAEAVAEAASAGDHARVESLLRGTTELMASIHNAGLVHGDALLRNVLAARPRALAFDLASWGRRTRVKRVEDLRRLLGSTLLAADGTAARAALQHYRQYAPDLEQSDDTLLALAEAYAAQKR